MPVLFGSLSAIMTSSRTLSGNTSDFSPCAEPQGKVQRVGQQYGLAVHLAPFPPLPAALVSEKAQLAAMRLSSHACSRSEGQAIPYWRIAAPFAENPGRTAPCLSDCLWHSGIWGYFLGSVSKIPLNIPPKFCCFNAIRIDGGGYRTSPKHG